MSQPDEREPGMPDGGVSADRHDDEPAQRPEVAAAMAVDDSAKSMAAAHGAVMAAESAVGTHRIRQLRDEQAAAMKRWQAAQQELADAREAGDPTAIEVAGVAEARTYRDFILSPERHDPRHGHERTPRRQPGSRRISP
ncbi:hypothetical protein [Amycolatopsis magusensis]|uniref:hypothetical protein n=1 Tax=Amycolatopsis magusensis TaxID=882444 RepID=UPI0037B316E6